MYPSLLSDDQVREVEDRPGQKEYARDSRQSSNGDVKAAPEAAYQSRDNGDDEDLEGAPAEQVSQSCLERHTVVLN